MSHKARKRFGQNFLNDRQVIERIISTISPKKKDDIVEIGPGKGAITFPLLEQLDKLNVVEIDRDLIALLRSNQNTKLIIHEADVLSFDFGQISNNLRVVGNLPYNISTHLLTQWITIYEKITYWISYAKAQNKNFFSKESFKQVQAILASLKSLNNHINRDLSQDFICREYTTGLLTSGRSPQSYIGR